MSSEGLVNRNIFLYDSHQLMLALRFHILVALSYHHDIFGYVVPERAPFYLSLNQQTSIIFYFVRSAYTTGEKKRGKKEKKFMGL